MKPIIRKVAGVVGSVAGFVLGFLFFLPRVNGYTFAGMIVSAAIALPCFGIWAYLDPENESYTGE